MNSGTVSHNMRPMSLPVSGHIPSPMPVSNSFYQDLHTRQTIDRLQCIQKHLKNPAGFVRTASELLEWCSDARAFQGQFHQCLMSCLTVVNDVAGKPGFNLELCYKLIAMCHSQREKFNPNAAAMIEIWMQNIQKLRMMQHHPHMDPLQQNSIPPQGVPGASPLNNMNHSKMGYPQTHIGQRSHEPMWNQTGQQPGPHPNPHPSLSVITTATVWGVSATQTPPVPVHSQSSSSYPQQHIGHPGTHMGRSNIHSNYSNNYSNKANSADAFQNSSMFSAGHRRMPQGSVGPQGHHMHSDQTHHPPAAAAAAAAVAAAAATATATATATVLKEHQDQNQINSFDQGPVGPMSQTLGELHLHQSMPLHQQHMPTGPNMHGVPPQTARLRPQMSSQYARAASVPTSFPITSPRPLTHKGPPMYNNDVSYKGPCRPQQGYGPIQYNGGPNIENPFNKAPDGFNHVGLHRQASGGAPGYSTRVSGTTQPHMYPNPQQPYYSYQNQPNQADSYPQPPSQRPHLPPQYSNESRYSNTQPQIPGNPTPPLTPGSAHNVPPYPSMTSIGLHEANPGPQGSTAGPYFPPPINNSGPSSQIDSDDLRLSFPVRDGIVLPAFRLKHNLSLSSHAFHLRDHVYKTLSERADLDLQFKCYHHDDTTKHTNWPHSVQVGVNGTELSVPRGMNRGDHKPLYLKKVCQPGRNAIDINVSACCCSHFFVLQVVHRPGLQFVLRSLLGKRMLPDVNCRRKIKQHFSSGTISANDAVISNTAANGTVESFGTMIKVSLLCPITYCPMKIPARGQECRHVQCFDLESYLQLNSENATWLCPICHKTALLEVLEVDEFIQNIIKTLKGRDCQLVSIDANCMWKQLPGSTYPGGRPRGGPLDLLPNGMVKQEPYRDINVKQEPMPTSNVNFSMKQEKPFISALQIKQEPHHQRGDGDGPPSKRLKNAGINLKSLPVPSPGSAGGCNKIMPENSTGYPPSHDASRFGNNPMSSGSHLGGNFMRGVSGVAVEAEMSDQVAANDMVPIEKRLNPAVAGGDACPLNGGSPYRKRRCPETPKTPQGPKTPIRPPSSSAVLTPQSVNSLSGNCSTPSSLPNNNSNQLKSSNYQCSSSSVDASGSVINPTTPVVTLPNCDNLDQVDSLGILDSFFEDNVRCGNENPATSSAFDATSGTKAEKEAQDGLTSLADILPDAELMDILPLDDLGAVTTTSNNNTEEEDILSLFDSAT